MFGSSMGSCASIERRRRPYSVYTGPMNDSTDHRRVSALSFRSGCRRRLLGRGRVSRAGRGRPGRNRCARTGPGARSVGAGTSARLGGRRSAFGIASVTRRAGRHRARLLRFHLVALHLGGTGRRRRARHLGAGDGRNEKGRRWLVQARYASLFSYRARGERRPADAGSGRIGAIVRQLTRSNMKCCPVLTNRPLRRRYDSERCKKVDAGGTRACHVRIIPTDIAGKV